GTFAGTTSLTYTGTSSEFRYNLPLGVGTLTTTDKEWPSANGPYNVKIFAADGLNLHADRTVPGVLTLETGRLITGNFTLTVASGGSVVRDGTNTDGYIDGNFKKTFTAAGTKAFEVGTANGYSPASINATVGTFPADFTVKATQGTMPGLNGAG